MINVVIFNDTSGGHIGCNLVMDNIRYLCDKYKLNIKYMARVKEIKEPPVRLKKAMKRAHIVIINGEGTFHHCSGNIDLLLNACKSKPTVLINSVWDKVFTDRINIVKNLKLISVRESLSYNQLKEIVNKEKLLITPDLSFYDTEEEIEKIGYSDSVMNTLRLSLLKNKNYNPFAPNATMPSVQAYVSWLKSLDLHVTGRFHGVCFSAKYNIPFLAFPSNCHKIESILKDMNCSDLLIYSKDEVNKKKSIAKKKIIDAYNYAKKAHNKIEALFQKIQTLGKKLT